MPSSSRLDTELRLITRAALLVMAVVVLHFTTRATWSPTYQINDGGWSGGFFWAQAESMLVRARLDVDPSHIISECFEREGRCYGYFGLTPSLVRLPVLGFLRMFHTAFTPVFLTGAILLGYWAALRMLRRSLGIVAGSGASRPAVLTYAALVALALGPGGTLVFVSRPAVYEEALAWGVAGLLLAMNHVWAWRNGETRRLWPAVVFAVGAANARPTAAPASVVLGLLVAAWCYQEGRGRRALAAALCISILPGLTAAGVFWLKLRAPIPSVLMNKQVQEAPHWRDILRRNGGRTAGLIFTPTALTAYFRPDSVTYQPEWPYFDFRFRQATITWVPPLPKDGAYVEPIASLTATMPLAWLLNLAAVLWLTREAWRALDGRNDDTGSRVGRLLKQPWVTGAGLLVSAAAMTPLTMTTVGITTRYLADFYATSAVGVACAPFLILPWLDRRPALAWPCAGIAALLVVWSVVVTLSLHTRLVW